MKASELKNFTLEELKQKYNALQGELFNLRIEMRAGRIEKPHKLKLLRRDIARVKTIMNEDRVKISVENSDKTEKESKKDVSNAVKVTNE